MCLQKQKDVFVSPFSFLKANQMATITHSATWISSWKSPSFPPIHKKYEETQQRNLTFIEEGLKKAGF